MVKVTGGDKLQAALNKIAAQLKKSGAVEVGFINGATYPDGTPVAAVALFNEFGTGKIPPRPFFRNMIKKNSKKWPINLMTALKATGYDATKSLGLVGEEIVGELEDSILSNTPPPNAKSTLKQKAKKHETPKTLIDIGLMLKSVTHVVK